MRTFLFVDFISNNNKIAYAQDSVKIERNIKLISPEFSLEVETARILHNKDHFITSKGLYIIILNISNSLMLFYDATLVEEIEVTLFEIEKEYSKETARAFHRLYLELSESHLDNVGLTSEVGSE